MTRLMIVSHVPDRRFGDTFRRRLSRAPNVRSRRKAEHFRRHAIAGLRSGGEVRLEFWTVTDTIVAKDLPLRSEGHRRAVWLVLLAVSLTGSVWAWSGTGAHLRPAGNAIGVGRLTVGVPIYVSYPLFVEGGEVQLDGVRLEGTSGDVASAFFVAQSTCSVGVQRELPVGCDLMPVDGTTVAEGAPRLLVARFELRSSETAHPGDTVVSYHDGLHRREAALGVRVCLSSEADAACP